MSKETRMPNFLEVKSTEEANRVNQELYTLLRFSDTRDAFIFKKRRGV